MKLKFLNNKSVLFILTTEFYWFGSRLNFMFDKFLQRYSKHITSVSWNLTSKMSIFWKTIPSSSFSTPHVESIQWILKVLDKLRGHQMCYRNFIQQQRSETVWSGHRAVGRSRGKLELTRAQSKSTASSTSSWWPILDTPKSSSSWWVIRSSWSPPTFSLSKVLMYCWRQSSRPGGTTQTGRQKKNFSAARQGDILFLSFLAEIFWFFVKQNQHLHKVFWWAWHSFPCQNMCCKCLQALK